MADTVARRQLLRAAAGTALLAPATGPVAAHDDHDSAPEHTVVAGPGGELVFDPERLEVDPGATVRWEWDSDNHTVTPTAQPDAAEWEGTSDVHDAGHVYEHTFDVEGHYEYECTPHAAADMTGEVLVGDATPQFAHVVVGPGGDLVFEPEEFHVEPGTTVTFEWDSDNHNVNPTSVPEGATWEGHPEVVDSPNVYEHTFEIEGVYEFECTPHAVADMTGRIVVDESAGTDDAGPDDDGADDADAGADGDSGTDGADGTENGTTVDDAGTDDSDDGSPGFGVPAALAALGGALAGLRRRLSGD